MARRRIVRLGIHTLAMVCLTLVLLPLQACANSRLKSTPSADAGQNFARFVIADFDGDQKPDFATVHVDESHIRSTDYSIHLRLSQGLESAIGLTAPSGGLQLFSRDVNGDDFQDVVVRTALDSNLVAVLINDGHGNFNLAKPESFPELQNEPDLYLNATTPHVVESLLLLPPRGTPAVEPEYASAVRLNIVREPVKAELKPDACDFSYQSDFGRSPPDLQ